MWSFAIELNTIAGCRVRERLCDLGTLCSWKLCATNEHGHMSPSHALDWFILPTVVAAATERERERGCGITQMKSVCADQKPYAFLII